MIAVLAVRSSCHCLLSRLYKDRQEAEHRWKAMLHLLDTVEEHIHKRNALEAPLGPPLSARKAFRHGQCNPSNGGRDGLLATQRE